MISALITSIFIGVLCIIPASLTVYSGYLFISSGTMDFTAYSLGQWYPYRNLAFTIHAVILIIDLLFLKNFRSKEVNLFRGIWTSSLVATYFSHALGRMLLPLFLLVSPAFSR